MQSFKNFHGVDIIASIWISDLPDMWKESLVTPLLKRQGLDLVFKHFRPISDLSFVSKLAERVAADQIQSYSNEHDLFHGDSAISLPAVRQYANRHRESQEWYFYEHRKSTGNVVDTSWSKRRFWYRKPLDSLRSPPVSWLRNFRYCS